MHLDIAGTAHRHLGDRRRVAAIAHELRDAAMAPGCERPAPVAAFGGGIEHRQVFGVVRHQRAAKFQRVFPGRLRHLVHEAFDIDAVLVGVDAAPGAHRHVGVAHRVLDQQVGNAVPQLRVAGRGPHAL